MLYLRSRKKAKQKEKNLLKQLLKYLLRLVQGLDSLQHNHQFTYSNKKKGYLNYKSSLCAAARVVRGTVLEGSFGNEKNHYLLDKIKAKNNPLK